MTNSFVVVFFIYIFGQNIFSALAAQKCYQCSTTTLPGCADLNDNSADKICKTTTEGEINCLTYKYLLNNMEITYRGCRKLGDTCDDVKNALEKENKQFIDCGLCSTDLCKPTVKGTSGSVIVSNLSVGVLTIFSLIIKYIMQ